MITWDRDAAEEFYARDHSWRGEADTLGSARLADMDAAGYASSILLDIDLRRYPGDRFAEVRQMIISAREALDNVTLVINEHVVLAYLQSRAPLHG